VRRQEIISAIIVNYHCASLTLRAVESILREKEEIEVLVVDNSVSEDEARHLTAHLPYGVILLVSSANEGFGRACNRAYQQSQGEMVLLLNPDACLLPDALGHLKRTLLARADAGAVGLKTYWDAERRFLLPPSLFPSPWLALRDELWRLHPTLGWFNSLVFRRHAMRVWQSEQALADSALSGGAVLLKRSAIERSGGLFDERFFMYYEDSDLMLRLKRANYRLYVEPSAECIHYYEHSAAKMGLMADAGAQYFDKHFSRSWLLRWARWLADKAATLPQQSFSDLGALQQPPTFPVPSELHGGWLLEISPSPFFIPSIGRFGDGEIVDIPVECWRLLHPGNYYCRLGRPSAIPGSTFSWRWEITQ
jgi:GT2 family glycosyltransferase